VLIVVDEAYYEMVEDDAFPDAFAYLREGRRNIVILRTFSKVYGLAGVRIGYGFGHLDTIAPLRKIKPAFNVNVLAQAAGVAALTDTEFVEQSVAVNRAGRHALYRGFDRLGLEYAESHTNFVLVRIGPTAERIQQALLRRGIIVRPCAGYDLPEFLRISIGTAEQNERLIAALEELLEAQG
jgi:histidinol-phosphate aminotransferase